MSGSKLLNIRIEPALKVHAKMLSRQHNRSLSNWISQLIKSEVEKAELSRTNTSPKG